MAYSAIPAVRAEIESLLQGAPALSGVTIARGSSETPDNEQIILDRATSSTEYAAIGGNPPLNEQIRLSFVIGVIVTGGAYQAAEERAFALLDAVAAQLRTDLSLDQTWLFGRITSVEQSYQPVDKGRAATVTFVAEGTARI